MTRSIPVSGLCLGVTLLVTAAHAAVEITDLGGDRFLVNFRFTAPPEAETVHVAGSFNGWDPAATAMQRQGNTQTFSTDVVLARGRYEYKFVIDGSTWRTDMDNPNRTDGYQNALLFVGLAADDAGPTVTTRAPIASAPPAPPPAEITAALAAITAADPSARAVRIAALFRDMPMPHVTDKTVTFIWAGEATSAPTVRVFAEGARLGYALQPVPDVGGLYALTLAREPFPDRWAYLYAIERSDRTDIQLDPHGWSVTTRAGEPVTRGVAASPRVGRIELIPAVRPKSGDLPPRDVYVYLPPGYDRGSDRYPVLYMHDGQNSWDDPVEPFGHGGWTVNLVADKLIAEGEVSPFIVVGVANTTDRMTEYGPGEDILDGAKHPYLRFLKDDLKPLIDAKYRTEPDAGHTFMAGSSLGGAISLQAALLFPGVYGGAACLSPALMFKDAAGRSYFDLLAKVGARDVRLYVDHGTAGESHDGAERTDRLIAELQAKGWRDGVNLVHFVDAGAAHNERAWRARLDRPLRFLFGREAKQQDARQSPQ